PIRGMDFQTRSLLFALRAGEPFRVARSLALEAGTVSAAGGRAWAGSRRLPGAAQGLTDRPDPPCTPAIRLIVGRAGAYLNGNWVLGLEECDRADQIFREDCVGVTWELDSAHTFALWSQLNMGQVREAARRWSSWLQEAKERGDLYAQTNLGTFIMAIIR